MKERPIIFSGEMVRAIIDGRKIQTRRVIKPQPTHGVQPDSTPKCEHRELMWKGKQLHPLFCPHGQPGDRLWVRETWAMKVVQKDRWNPRDVIYKANYMYRPHGNIGVLNREIERRTKWGPSIHMPRWASRLTLEVKAVRVERVRDISEKDADAEGYPLTEHTKDLHGFLDKHGGRYTTSIGQISFGFTWDLLNAKRGYGWNQNPYVWVIKFRRLLP